MVRPVTRVDPALPVGAMKTYQIAAPKATHTRSATCAEVDCQHHREGWKSHIDESSDLGKQQAAYIRGASGRRFTEERNDAGLTVFTFEAGQDCFASDKHRTSLDRPALFVVRGGDWRGNPLGEIRMHDQPEHWVEDFAEHQDRIKTQIEKG